MRRTMFLGAVTPIVALGVLGWTQAVLLAQTPKSPTVPTQPAPGPAGATVTPFGSDGSQPVAPAAQPSAKPVEFTSSPVLKTTTVEEVNLRNRYIELCKKKSLLMKAAQLKREIEALERETQELEAWAKADEAAVLLREVIEKHPNTKAARSANAAIQLIEARGREGFRDERFVPNDRAVPTPLETPFKEGRPAPERDFDRQQRLPDDNARPGDKLSPS
jgi:hypothetical protein